MNVEEFYNKSEYSKIDFGSNPNLFTKKELLDFANEYLEAITVTRCSTKLPTLLEKTNRVEVIDQQGRSYVNWKPTNKVELSLQDDKKTLKVFING